MGAKRPEPILSFVQIRSGNRGEDLGNRTDTMIKSPPPEDLFTSKGSN